MTEDEYRDRVAEIARTKRVMIGTPMRDHPKRQYTHSLTQTVTLLGSAGIPLDFCWVIGNSNLALARNEVAANFLHSAATDLIWIDDDLGWNPHDVLRLLMYDAPFVGGIAKKRIEEHDEKNLGHWCVHWTDGWHKHFRQHESMGGITVPSLGTGFLRTGREVFEKIIAARPDLKRTPRSDVDPALNEHFYRFFAWIDEVDDQASEDIQFCRLWRSVGGEVWNDPHIHLTHVGEREFSGMFVDALKHFMKVEYTDDEAA